MRHDDLSTQFRDAIRAAGLMPPNEVIADGNLHRFSSSGCHGDDAGWYVLYNNAGIPAGAFGDWRSGVEKKWRADIGRNLSPEEHEAIHQRQQAARKVRDEENDRRQQEAAQRASEIWGSCEPAADDHPYLKRKGIAAQEAGIYRGDLVIAGTRVDGSLVIPLSPMNGDPATLQFITPDGRKLYLPGGRKAGCFRAVLKESGAPVYVAEGFATACSIAEALTEPANVVAAFDADNLLLVARALRERLGPTRRIVICADDDYRTAGNPGLSKATEAARAVGALLAVPTFADQRADAATDFNDLHQAEALDAVRACLDAAAPVPTVETTLAGADSVPTRAPAAADRLTSVSLIRGDTITPEAVRWLWGGFLAAGKLHVIAGAPGTGKTTLALAFSSTITTGGQWPDSSRSEQGQVLIWSGEDDPADTLVPRLMAAGADMRHVHFVGPAREGSEIVPFDPAHHFPALVEAAKAVGDVSLIIVDPIVSAVAGDGNKNGEVRRGLQPLVDAAGQLGAAVLGISHFSKGTAGRDVVERVTGSVAFGAVARVVLATAKLPDEDGGGRILVRAKSNLGPDGGGFGYELHQIEVPGALGLLASAVKWSDEIAGSARELLAIAESEHENGEGSAAREAEKWLLDLVEDEGGSVDRRRVMDAARAAGFSERTVHRARESLGLTIAQTGFGAQKRSIWRRGEKPIRANSAHSCQPQSLANMGAIGTNANLSDDSEVL